jgi:hypothetical protein
MAICEFDVEGTLRSASTASAYRSAMESRSGNGDADEVLGVSFDAGHGHAAGIPSGDLPAS